jgi:hypothetical protein
VELCGRSGQEVTRIAPGSETALFSPERGSRHDTSSDQSLLCANAERLCARSRQESALTSSAIGEQGLAGCGMRLVHHYYSQSACSVGWRGNKALWMAVPYTTQQAALRRLRTEHNKRSRQARNYWRTAEEDPSHRGPCSHTKQATTGAPLVAIRSFNMGYQVPRLATPGLSKALLGCHRYS